MIFYNLYTKEVLLWLITNFLVVRVLWQAAMTKLQSVIGGKWKILIMWYISVYKVQRFGELQRRIGNEITKSTLTKQLRELENDGWINRQIYQEIPPRVEYTLTELAESFVPILEQMKEWSETHLC